MEGQQVSLHFFSQSLVHNTVLPPIRASTFSLSRRFFFGKNKVMAVALGKSADGEYKDNIHLVSAELKGQTGLLFTNKTKKEVQR